MRRELREKFYRFLKGMELFIAVCIVVIIMVLTAITLWDYLTGGANLHGEEALQVFLQEMLTFVVGIEFVKMLIFHNPERVIDVLIFASSRQMIVEHTDGVETIIWIIGIGMLFAIQKFLIPHGKEEHPLEHHQNRQEVHHG
mgnify:FL=1